MKILKSLLVALLISMLHAVPSGAAVGSWTVTDIYSGDMNIITGVDQTTPNLLTIFEDYNEDNFIPYDSHDGYGVVNQFPDLGCPAGTCWFDKVFDKGINGEEPTGIWTFDFRVHNTTPWGWSDYHFEFWDSTFTTRYENFPVVPLSWNNDQFDNSAFTSRDGVNNSIVEFWSPGSHVPSETGQYWFQVDADVLPASFGIRQVATTVPEPVSTILFVTGGTLLAGRRYRKKRKQK